MSRATAVRNKLTKSKLSARHQANLLIILTSLKDAAIKTDRDNCVGMAKEAAYSFILSFFPLLIVFIAVFFIFGDPMRSVKEIEITLWRVLPLDSYQLVDVYI